MKYNIFVIFITLFKGNTVAGCPGESACPLDKPYCSDVGCMFECPDFMYINGSNCVSDCGDGYVQEGKMCTESCRKGQYILETGKWTLKGLYNEKTCLNNCPQAELGHQTYVVNRTCVETCPSDLKFIAGNECSQECPANMPFKLKVTLNDINYHKCVNRCDRLSENGFCSDKCSNGKVTLNSTCLQKCPVSHPILDGTNVCVKQCSTEILLSNDTHCLCPEQTPFIQNYTCVRFCNGTYTYITLINKLSYCTDSCSVGRFSWNGTCVWMCPDKTYTFQNVCLEACPVDSMFVLNTSMGIFLNQCTERCPYEMYNLNYTCVKYCPSGYYLFNKTCFQRCPEHLVSRDFTFQYTVWMYFRMLKESRTYAGKECVLYCSRDEVLYDNDCLLQCPLSHRFVTDGVCHQEECSTQYYYNSTRSTNRFCTSQCDELHFLYLNMCVTACPSNFVVFNGSCTLECPADSSFETNITVKVGCDYECSLTQFRQYTACLDQCPSDYFNLNNSCVLYCPPPLLAHNGTCVNTCPPSSRYLKDLRIDVIDWGIFGGHAYRREKRILTKECVSHCETDLYNKVNNTCDRKCKTPNRYIINNTCVDSCPKNTYQNKLTQGIMCENECPATSVVYNQSCLTSCPTPYTFMVNNVCLIACPDGTYQLKSTKGVKCVDYCPTNLVLYNDTCIDKCPNGQYDFNSLCVSTCPSEQPHILKEQQPKCIRYCSSGELLQDGKCISHYKCNTSTMVVYDGQCLEKCPSSFVLVTVLCVHIRTFVILLTTVSTVTITTCIYARKSLWKYFIILKFFFKSSDTIGTEAKAKTVTRGDYLEMKYLANTEAEDTDEDLSVDEETSLL